MTVSVTLLLSDREFFLHFNGQTHLRLPQSEFLGLQSWVVTHGPVDGGSFKVEVYTRSGAAILLEYDRREIWDDVLRAFDRLREVCERTYALTL